MSSSRYSLRCFFTVAIIQAVPEELLKELTVSDRPNSLATVDAAFVDTLVEVSEGEPSAIRNSFQFTKVIGSIDEELGVFVNSTLRTRVRESLQDVW